MQEKQRSNMCTRIRTGVLPKRKRALARGGQRQQKSRFDGSFSRHSLFKLLLSLGWILLPRVHSFCTNQWIVSPSLRLVATKTNAVDSFLSLKASPSNQDNDFSGNRRADHDNNKENDLQIVSRRQALFRGIGCTMAATAAVSTWTIFPSTANASPEDDVKEMRALIQQAKTQLESVPPLLQEEKWDGVRQVLMEAPLRDCWSKSTPILKKYAEALGETPKGDELAALEGREELLQHLRFLDMAVYNNVFNPIATEGKTGASKALIDSYYNDPAREFEASKKAIEGLIELSN